MSATASIRIDDKHARAICDEIGDRLREALRREMVGALPARLKALIALMEAAERDAAPSIVPSLDDMAAAQASNAPLSTRSRHYQPVKRGSGPSSISFR